MARLFKRGRIWFAWVPKPGGGTRKVSTNCTDKKAAEKRAGELELESLDPSNAAANRETTLDSCTEFLKSRQRRGRAEGTLHHYRVKLGHVVRLMPKRLGDVDAASCERFIETRLEEGAAQTTVKKELRALGATLRHARRRGVYLRDVEAVIPELEETYKPRERTLSPLELVALCNVLPPRRAAHVVFIVATGARWSESVRAQAVDCDGVVVFLRGTKTKAARRTVPIPPTMLVALSWSLKHARQEGGLLFDSWTNVRRDLGEACATLGVAPVTPNDLRRTFGTWLRIAGLTPDLIGLAMGHTSSRMAELVYGRIGPKDLGRLIAERSPALDFGTPVASGLLMGGTLADLGGSEPTEETRPPGLDSVFIAENRSFLGAHSRNRTRDTGIFNPSSDSENVDGSEDPDPRWAANGLTFRARARRWLTREAA